MIRMIREDDYFACWWWYNWYIAHTNVSFETEALQFDDFKKRIESIRIRYPWIVLQEDNDLRGYAYLEPFNERAAYDWTCGLSIYVAPDMNHHGYGRQLMKAILDLAKLDGYRNVISIITDTNEASIQFHHAFGFESLGAFPASGYKNNQWLGVHYYGKVLNPTLDAMPVPKNLDPFIEKKEKRIPISE
ncbi:MAG: N-acetyltransferase family protein [Erysipelotrichia bacterium]|nr:N-acetyltransferase family protein [Erysipelotrichia bacterium]